MAKENDGQTLRDYGNRKKRIRRRRNILISSLLLIAILAGGLYLFRLYNRNYQNYEVINASTTAGENAVGYISSDSELVKYSKDGALAFDMDGKVIWNGSYEISNPIADICGKYVVIADQGNQSVYIYNGKGEVGRFDTLHKIMKVEVASQGVVAVLMEDGNNNYISIYDKAGKELVEKVTSVSEEGYPMDISLSEDGEKLVISYLSVTTGELVSKVSFYNFGEVGKNYTDRFVGAFVFEDKVVARVTFLNNNTVCVYKEDGFHIYDIDEIPNLLHEQKIEGNIQSVIHNEKYTGVVYETSDEAPKHLLIYNLEGDLVLDKKLDFDYDKIYLSGEEIIMYDKQTCLVMKMNGSTKFQYTFEGNIEGFYSINNMDRYYWVNGSEISQILLVE
jgi:hypothetical protein